MIETEEKLIRSLERNVLVELVIKANNENHELRNKLSDIKRRLNERSDYSENQITWMKNVNYINKLSLTRVYKEQIEFLNDVITSIK